MLELIIIWYNFLPETVNIVNGRAGGVGGYFVTSVEFGTTICRKPIIEFGAREGGGG